MPQQKALHKMTFAPASDVEVSKRGKNCGTDYINEQVFHRINQPDVDIGLPWLSVHKRFPGSRCGAGRFPRSGSAKQNGFGKAGCPFACRTETMCPYRTRRPPTGHRWSWKEQKANRATKKGERETAKRSCLFRMSMRGESPMAADKKPFTVCSMVSQNGNYQINRIRILPEFPQQR